MGRVRRLIMRLSIIVDAVVGNVELDVGMVEIESVNVT